MVNLISVQTLTASTEISANVDPRILSASIQDVQTESVAPVLGAALYGRLIEGIKADDLTSDEKLLLSTYVRPVLVNGVLADLSFRLSFRFDNAGLSRRTTENTAAAQFDELQKISDVYKARAVSYANALRAFLCANVEKYPKFREPGSDAPKAATYDVGIYLG